MDVGTILLIVIALFLGCLLVFLSWVRLESKPIEYLDDAERIKVFELYKFAVARREWATTANIMTRLASCDPKLKRMIDLWNEEQAGRIVL